MASKALIAADLFCGAGGTSTGLAAAAAMLGRRLELVAVNHWDRAVETHAKNHPAAAHFCQSLADLDPRKAVPGGKLDLLVASPECTHHSVARGGKPVNDQSRASAYCVHRWCAALDVRRVLIENVPEFQTWGPLGSNGRPLASGKGKLFASFIDTFRAMGYRVEWKVLNAADYGAATTRRRLFVQAAKGRTPIRWPEPTHEPDPQPGLLGCLPRWRAAREIIDWSLSGASIFNRARPLSENTLKRIEAGLKKFGGAAAEPFLIALHHMKQRDADGRSCRPLDQPVPTVLAGGTHIGLVEPFVVTSRNGCIGRPLGEPIPTITAGQPAVGVCEPFVMHTTHHGEGRVHRPSDPLPCVTGANRGELAFILPHRQFDGMQVDGVDRPMRTITAQNGGCNAIVEPFILPPEGIHRGNQPRPVDRPMQTVTAGRGGGSLCEPFLVPYYRTGVPDSVDAPASTITTRDRLGLVEPDGVRLDIRFRMLQPHELAAAMGFPPGYQITGNRGEQVRQIGNAVEVNQARALATAMLEA